MQLLEQVVAGADRRRRRAGHRAAARAGRPVRGRRRRRGVHHARPAAHSHAKRQARPRPPRVWAAPASTCRCKVNQAGVMPIIFASSLLMLPSLLFGSLASAFDAERQFWRPTLRRLATCSARHGVRLQPLLHRADLLLLLLLDGHHVQSQGHVREPEGLRHVHSRLSARQADGRLPGKGDDPHHLRRRRLPGAGGDRADDDFRLARACRRWWPAFTAARAC